MSVYTIEEAKEFGRQHARNGLFMNEQEAIYYITEGVVK